MKKIKLLTSLGAVTALGGGVALTATSCSEKKLEIIMPVTKVFGEWFIPISVKRDGKNVSTNDLMFNFKLSGLDGFTVMDYSQYMKFSLGWCSHEIISFTKFTTEALTEDKEFTLTIFCSDNDGHFAKQDFKMTALATEPTNIPVVRANTLKYKFNNGDETNYTTPATINWTGTGTQTPNPSTYEITNIGTASSGTISYSTPVFMAFETTPAEFKDNKLVLTKGDLKADTYAIADMFYVIDGYPITTTATEEEENAGHITINYPST